MMNIHKSQQFRTLKELVLRLLYDKKHLRRCNLDSERDRKLIERWQTFTLAEQNVLRLLGIDGENQKGDLHDNGKSLQTSHG